MSGTGEASGLALSFNAGSSSLRYELVEARQRSVLVQGAVERIGESASALTSTEGGESRREEVAAPDHSAAFAAALARLRGSAAMRDGADLAVVGHRVVHGGTRFSQPVVVDDDVEEGIGALARLAPLHNPIALAVIRAARRAIPDVPHVAVFDTAFHAGLPPAAATYALPRDVSEREGVRRFGFHGISYAYVSRRAARLLGRDVRELRLVVLHLGSGASICAIDGGESAATSMGMTPLEGLMMGTRSGDVDPGAVLALARRGYGTDELEAILGERGGLLGLSGHRDVRDVVAAAPTEEAAALALDVYVHRLRHYIGAYLAHLGGCDGIVFTGGVGEHQAIVRARALETLSWWGIVLDARANEAPSRAERVISRPGSRVPVLVVPTDEAFEIAVQSFELVTRGARP